MKRVFQLCTSLLLLITVQSVHGYVGPGAGLSAIGSVLAFLGAIVLLIVGFLWYPIKRMLKSRREKVEQKIDDETNSETERKD